MFGSLSSDLGGWVERLEPDCLSEALKASDLILALHDHEAGNLLGSTRAGTLRLVEDSIGLAFEIMLPDTQTGRDVMTLATRGDLGGASFGCRPDKKALRWEKQKAGPPISVIGRVAALMEVSVVALPAYAAAGITSVAAAPARLETPAQAGARAAMVKMREAVAG